MLSVENISKTFDRKPVLKNISFTQDIGETIVFMGRNGVGKTTLFRIISGLMTCDKGSILFNGNDLLHSEPLNRKKWFTALLFLLIFPIFDERLQFFIPRRIPDIYDAIADILGGFIGAHIRKNI